MNAEQQKQLIHKRLLSGTAALKQPNITGMTQEDRLLRVVLMCYLKHSGLVAADEIGWNELNDAAHNEICNTIGNNAFVEWGELMERAEVDQ